MELTHKFEVPLGVEDAWRFANDPMSAVSCMPGATFEGVDPDGKLRGRIKVKLGAMVSNFAIEARYVDVDPVQHSMKVVSEGSEAKGGGRTSAEIFMKIDPKSEGASLVNVTIQLRMSGKIAQFGKGMLQDVSEALLGQFLENVKRRLGEIASSGERTATAPSPILLSAATHGHIGYQKQPNETAKEDDAIDLFKVARQAMAKRLLPVAVLVAGFVLVLIWALR